MPIYMRLPKQRGSHVEGRDADRPVPHVHTGPVNVRDLERVFDDGAEVTPTRWSRRA